MSMNSYLFDWVSPQDLATAIDIEARGFPADEAASLDSFRFRQHQAGELFLGVYTTDNTSKQLIGYVCSTLSPATTLTHESMGTHVPGSRTICIHSVCVAPEHKRKGVGLALLKEYISRLQVASKSPTTPYERISLITHEELRGFYEKAGFEWLGRSSVIHGSRPWFEMRKVLREESIVSDANSLPSEDTQAPTQTLPPGLWEALQSSSRNKPTSKPLSEFDGGLEALVNNDANKFDLLCPRAECGSIILKTGVAQLVERASVQMEPPNQRGHPLLPSLPPPSETTHWWLVGPSPMAFENIGFTRPAESLPVSRTGKKLKLLACAECDLGPLGWSEQGGTEYWLACSRVGYRQ